MIKRLGMMLNDVDADNNDDVDGEDGKDDDGDE